MTTPAPVEAASYEQWRHTEPDPHTGRWPLAPWTAHPTGPLDVDLVGELLTELRQAVTMWTAHERRYVAPRDREMADWCGARVDTARDALRLVERLIARANHRADLLAQRTERTAA